LPGLRDSLGDETQQDVINRMEKLARVKAQDADARSLALRSILVSKDVMCGVRAWAQQH
jgi:hypothetical protein